MNTIGLKDSKQWKIVMRKFKTSESCVNMTYVQLLYFLDQLNQAFPIERWLVIDRLWNPTITVPLIIKSLKINLNIQSYPTCAIIGGLWNPSSITYLGLFISLKLCTLSELHQATSKNIKRFQWMQYWKDINQVDMRCTQWLCTPGPLFTKKTPSYQYRDSHYKPETVVRPS